MHISLISLIVIDVFLLLTIIVPYIRKRVSIFLVGSISLVIAVIIFLDGCFTVKTIEDINIFCTTIAMLIYVVLSSILVLIETSKEYERGNGKGYERAINKIYEENDYDISKVSFRNPDEK